MNWIEVELFTTSEASDAIAERLTQIQAQGIAVEDPDEFSVIYNQDDTGLFVDPDFFESLPDYVRIRAYFSADHSPVEFFSEEAVKLFVELQLREISEFLDVGDCLVNTRTVKEEDWAESWKAHYHPISVTDRLTIVPSWEDYKPKAGEVIVQLDPGSTFGTGTHESTFMCLEYIDQYLKSDDTVLDLGCGSGILAITAKKLGAPYVQAIDIDPNAVRVLQDNALKNNCEIIPTLGTIEDKALDTYSLMLVNILAEVIVDLAPSISDTLVIGGHVICSGIIKDKEQLVLDAFEKQNLKLVNRKEKKDWVALVYVKSASI